MATRTRKRKKTNVKAHKRRTSSGVVRVKAHCRRPPQRAWQRAIASEREWGF
jgi:hypothetical protein